MPKRCVTDELAPPEIFVGTAPESPLQPPIAKTVAANQRMRRRFVLAAPRYTDVILHGNILCSRMRDVRQLLAVAYRARLTLPRFIQSKTSSLEFLLGV